ncbi:MAG TPA: carbon-phosphorus lyase [Bacillus bacterium]|uniref:Carbon-phosphorus lyase complex subunit PhnI n=1 Tax=Siminovitchia fordii TaxID=254759 RepID=A0ABQ4K852_9BACI|nr:carbon-phosphorus lyase complex subunit PhnI [Siminovitchia fordii]GIN21914.1 carbon-phosphorus lyase complex subunit PhnI [Siminovitchia fordii]HBZ11796.1 carbon-phosphorus lyase [Bacillus sp. (in: firmicutes)]
MAYVAVKGGTEAIEESIKRLTFERIRLEEVLEIKAIMAGMRGMIDQVMSESSLYSELLAALAIKQSEGNMEEAVFLLRAHRSTLPRNYYTRVIETDKMFVERRISASFKDIPGGQILGATYDYTHRLMDFDLLSETKEAVQDWLREYMEENVQMSHHSSLEDLPKVVDYLRKEKLFPFYEENDTEPLDVTKRSVQFPTTRSERLQILTRGQTGAVTSLGYAAIRGYGAVHPTVGELRVGMLPLTISDPADQTNDEENDYYIGQIKVTEVESFIPITTKNEKNEEEIEFEIGYGICYGQNETKAIAMSILDQALEHGKKDYPTHDEEFILLHIDSVESSGFISHLKLPHYVTFQSKLDSVRKIKQGAEQHGK